MTQPAISHLTKFACLDCRRVFKRKVEGQMKRTSAQPIEVRVCPFCGGEAYLVSSNFRAPRRNGK
jgi:hypothetical protein